LRSYLGYLHHINEKVRFFLPVTTHDTGAPAQLFGKAEAAVPRYAVTALMGTGQTGIVQGVEYGYGKKIDFIGRQEKLMFQENRYIAEKIKIINEILADSSVFHRGGNIEFIDGHHGAVLGAIRLPEKDGDESYLIFANLDIHSGYTLRLDLSAFIRNTNRIQLEDKMRGTRYESPVHDMKVDIGPCDVIILRIMD
jgi:hypothetical protein